MPKKKSKGVGKRRVGGGRKTARYLLKQLLAAKSGQRIAGTSAYLAGIEAATSSSSQVKAVTDWFQADLQEQALRQRACFLVVEAAEILGRAGGGKLQFEGEAWNSNTVALIRAAKAHLQLVLFQTFASSVTDIQKENALPYSTIGVLEKLVALFGLSQVLESSGDFLEARHLSLSQVGCARDAHYQLLKELRPEAVGLVDAFAISDYVLDSSLGRYDGDVYRDLLERAQFSPLNDTEEGPAWPGILDHLLNRKVQSKL